MKRWVVLSAVAIAALSGSGYAALHFYRVHEYEAAHAVALDALKRAYDYRDSGTLIFEPRWKDFQVADDEQRRLSLVGWREQIDAETLHTCGSELSTYRAAVDDLSEALNSAEDAAPGLSRQALVNDADGFMETQKSIQKDIEDECPMIR